jgi:hypothetical protein
MAGMAATASIARSAASNINFLNFFSFSFVFSIPDSILTGSVTIRLASRRPVLGFLDP